LIEESLHNKSSGLLTFALALLVSLGICESFVRSAAITYKYWTSTEQILPAEQAAPLDESDGTL
jgi:hypothetical protein